MEELESEQCTRWADRDFLLMREKALSLFRVLMCVTIGPHSYIIRESSPGKLGSLGALHLLSHTHLDMLYLKIGKCTCIHRPCKNMRVGNAEPIYHSQWKKKKKKAYRRLLLQEKQMNEKGEQSANNVPRLRIKVSVLLLSIWEAEMLLWVLIRKRKILKEMWAAQDTFS